MFNVICLETGEPLKRADGKPIAYDNGADAASDAQALTLATGKKHQPRRAVCTEDWRARERARFENGTYKPLPDMLLQALWYENHVAANPELRDHFAHASTEKESYIAFTESEEKGAADRQTRIKIGRYLKQYFSGVLTDSKIAELSALFDVDYENIPIEFATTPDDIEHVYRNGPSSCMSKGPSSYSSECHPTRVYGAGDLAIAYIKREGSITGRCLSWPDKKIHARIYGDETRMRRVLSIAGYKAYDRDDEWIGAKLLRINHDSGGYVMPYLDIGCGADVMDKKHLKLVRHGDIEGGRTDGLSEEPGRPCDYCGDNFDPDSEGTYISGSGVWYCDSCTNENTFYCEIVGETFLIRDGVEMSDGGIWSERAFDRHGFTCEGTDTRYDSREHECVELNDGTTWHVNYFAEHGFICDECGEAFANEDRSEHTDKAVCDSCYVEPELELEQEKVA